MIGREEEHGTNDPKSDLKQLQRFVQVSHQVGHPSPTLEPNKAPRPISFFVLLDLNASSIAVLLKFNCDMRLKLSGPRV
jgi:hypothetical protein